MLMDCNKFKSHSGLDLGFKIECDVLGYEDIQCIAKLIAKVQSFRYVHGIKRGGTRLAVALREYVDDSSNTILIVDDVLTTGRSMEKVKEIYQSTGLNIVGWVIFARGEVPEWVNAVFTLNRKLFKV